MGFFTSVSLLDLKRWIVSTARLNLALDVHKIGKFCQLVSDCKLFLKN